LHYIVAGFASFNPTLSLTTGCTYTFNINVNTLHPLSIVTATTGSPPPAVTSGITGQNPSGVTNGVIVYTPPAATTVFYYCLVHGFFGEIVVTDAMGGSSSAIGKFNVASSFLSIIVFVAFLL